MGFRFRQRIKIVPGLHLNIGKKGTSFSIGRPGATVNVGGKRGPRATVGIPGTGLSYTENLSSKSSEAETPSQFQPKGEGISALRLLGYGILALFLFLILRGLFFG